MTLGDALSETVATKADLDAVNHRLDTAIAVAKNDVIRWVFTINIATAGVLLTAIKLLT